MLGKLKPDLAKLYKSAIVEFRNEPGIILYQIFIDKNDSTKFITHEVFKNEVDFNQYLVLQSLNPIIDFFNNTILYKTSKMMGFLTLNLGLYNAKNEVVNVKDGGF